MVYTLFLTISLFFAIPSFPMEQSVLTNSGLFPILMPKEISQKCIKRLLGFQEIGRLKQVSTTCNKCWNVENICLHMLFGYCACECLTPACSIVISNNVACTKVLRYFAIVKDENMFRHFWGHDNTFRKAALCRAFDIPYHAPLQQFMDVYAGRYVSQQEMHKLNLQRLICVLRRGEIDKAITILIYGKFDIFMLYEENCTLLQKVCRLKNLSLLVALLNNNYAINDINKRGVSVIHEVVRYGTSKMIEELLMRNVKVNVPDAQGQTPLHYAAKYGKYTNLCALLECEEVLVDARCGIEATPLYYAACRGGLRSVEALAMRGADINARTLSNSTPLHAASERGKFLVADFLLKNNALVNAADYEGRTPLHLVFYIKKNPRERKQMMIDLLIEYKADPNLKDVKGRKALCFARS